MGDQESEEFLPSFRSGTVLGTSYSPPIVAFFDSGVVGLDTDNYNTQGDEQVRFRLAYLPAQPRSAPLTTAPPLPCVTPARWRFTGATSVL